MREVSVRLGAGFRMGLGLGRRFCEDVSVEAKIEFRCWRRVERRFSRRLVVF